MRQLIQLPPQRYLQECFVHEQDGALKWANRPLSHFSRAHSQKSFNSRCAGRVATHKMPDNYLVVSLTYGGTSKHYYANRVIWTMHHGEIEEPYYVDHKDTDTLNNRLDNLRLALTGQNMMNSNLRIDNSSGIKGVYWDCSSLKWKTQVKNNKQVYSAGSFSDIQDAEIAVINLRKDLHGEFSNNGHSLKTTILTQKELPL